MFAHPSKIFLFNTANIYPTLSPLETYNSNQTSLAKKLSLHLGVFHY
jgi:hypothetical protein